MYCLCIENKNFNRRNGTGEETLYKLYYYSLISKDTEVLLCLKATSPTAGPFLEKQNQNSLRMLNSGELPKSAQPENFLFILVVPGRTCLKRKRQFRSSKICHFLKKISGTITQFANFHFSANDLM